VFVSPTDSRGKAWYNQIINKKETKKFISLRIKKAPFRGLKPNLYPLGGAVWIGNLESKKPRLGD